MARTHWTRYYLDPKERSLTTEPKQGDLIEYEALGDGLTFSMPVSDKEIEITGPIAARLFVSSETTDADLFLAIRLFDPNGKEVLFIGTNDPRVRWAWLVARFATQARCQKEPVLSALPYARRGVALVPGEPVELLIEILPTCIVVPAGHRLALNIRGQDYENGFPDAKGPDDLFSMKGVGPFLHADPNDRPAAIFGGKNRLYFETGQEPYLLLPIIP